MSLPVHKSMSLAVHLSISLPMRLSMSLPVHLPTSLPMGTAMATSVARRVMTVDPPVSVANMASRVLVASGRG